MFRLQKPIYIIEGLVALAEIQYAAGSTEIFTIGPGRKLFICDLTVQIAEGVPVVHRMETCRMGVREGGTI